MKKRSASQALELPPEEHAADDDDGDENDVRARVRKGLLAASLRHRMPCIPASLLVPALNEDDLSPQPSHSSFQAAQFIRDVCSGCVHRPQRVRKAWNECGGMGTTVTMVKPMCDKRLPLPPADVDGDAATMRAALEGIVARVFEGKTVTWSDPPLTLVQSFAVALAPEDHRALVEEALCVQCAAAARAVFNDAQKKGMARCIMLLADELAFCGGSSSSSTREKVHMYVCGSEVDGEVRLVEDTHPESLPLIPVFSTVEHCADNVATAASEEAIQQVLCASIQGSDYTDSPFCQAEGEEEQQRLGPTWVRVTMPPKAPCPDPPPPPPPPPGFFQAAPPPAENQEHDTESDSHEDDNGHADTESDSRDDGEGSDTDRHRSKEQYDEWRTPSFSPGGSEQEDEEDPAIEVYTSDWILPIFRLPMRWDAKRSCTFGAEVCGRMRELMFSPRSKLRERDPFSTGMYDAAQHYRRWTQPVVLERVPSPPPACGHVVSAPREAQTTTTDLWVCMMLASNRQPFLVSNEEEEEEDLSE